jgi:hypothetical protein
VGFAAVVGVVAALLAVPAPAGAVAGFGDVLPGAFYSPAVQWMVDNDITTGVSPTCFATSRTTTRGEAAAFIWRMEGRPEPGPAHGFTDVVRPWQQDPVSWMSDNGLTTGTTPTTFSPEQVVTRGQYATFLYRLAGEPDPGPAHGFTDVADGRYFTDAVQWMANEGLTTGTTPTTFSPERPLTRGEAATFLYRYKDEPPVVVDPASPPCLPWHRGRTNHTPAEAVQEFVDFIGFESASLGEFRQGDARSGEIDIDTTTDPLVSGCRGTTTTFVRLDASDNWVVIGAATSDIEITSPAHDAVVSSPLTTRGTHTVMTGDGVRMQLWPDGADTPVVNQAVTTGGGIFTLGDFEATVTWPAGVSGPATAIYRSQNPEPCAVSTVRVVITP